MLKHEKVLMKWNNANKKYFTEKGYVFTKTGDTFLALVTDLAKTSRMEVTVFCDYCNKEKPVPYVKYVKATSNPFVQKYACKSCASIKIKEVNLQKYGVENTGQLKEVQEKIKNTMIEKYGVESSLQLPETREKMNKSRKEKQTEITEKTKETNLKRYGVENPLQSSLIKEKRNKTNLERYGSKNPLLSPEINEKARATMQKKFGVDYTAESEALQEKMKNTSMERYGVNNPILVPDIKKKAINTLKKNYGVAVPFSSQIIQNRAKQTVKTRFGVENVLLLPEVREKIKKTNRRKYGAENPFSSETCKMKIKKTNLMKYGVKNPGESEKIKEKIRKTLFNNQSAPVSKQQLYLHELFGGELNYPVGTSSLDIAYPEEKVFVEYNGGGHNLSVIHGNQTKETFEKNEVKRKYALMRRGWKSIVIESKKDLLPDDTFLQSFIQMAKEYLKNGGSWIELDIDDKIIRSNQFKKEVQYKSLKRLK